MAYLLDLIAILFIVILSFFFCMSNDKIKANMNNSSCLLSHIVVGLSVIVFYKLAMHFKLNDKLNGKLNGKLNEIETTINVEQLSKGIYYLKVSDKNANKFIKE